MKHRASVDHGLFGGHLYDADTGYNYFGARYYNPKTGQFASEDPVFLALGTTNQGLENPQSLNSYAYANDNPINNVDPDGKTALGNALFNLSAGPYERYQAVRASIQQGSFQPLQNSFSNQFQSMFPQSSDSPQVASQKNMNLVMGFMGGGEGELANTVDHTVKYGADLGSQMNAVAGSASAAGLDLSEHATLRMTERNITINQVAETMKNDPVEYFHEGSFKNGFRDASSKIFVGQAQDTGRITTVINNTSGNYLSNLVSKGLNTLSKLTK